MLQNSSRNPLIEMMSPREKEHCHGTFNGDATCALAYISHVTKSPSSEVKVGGDEDGQRTGGKEQHANGGHIRNNVDKKTVQNKTVK